MDVKTLWNLSNAELTAVLLQGHALSAEALCGSYRGTSLGLPAFVDRIAWKAFRKVFARGEQGIVGHNVHLGKQRIFGPFRVCALSPSDPFGCREGLLLDYGAMHPVWHPMARLRDPLVAVVPGSSDLLLGASYLQLGWGVRTPSFFTLERET